MAAEKQKAATRALQEWLRASGASTLKVDGKLGTQTRAAAAAYSSPVTSAILAKVEELTPKVIARSSSPPRPELVSALKAACAKHGVSYARAADVVSHESRWNHSAVSSTGAVGLMQLTSWPIRQWNADGMSPRLTLEDRYTLATNVDVGVWYLKWCAKFMNVSASSDDPGTWALIYGAYNLGPGAMRLLVGGNYSHREVVAAWQGQSALLKQGGIERYVSNAKTLFA